MPHDLDGSRAMRAVNLTRALLQAGHEVSLWTADFDHRRHVHRFGSNTEIRSQGLCVRYLSSPGYNSNIGPARLYDHARLATNLRRQLKVLDPPAPDVAFVGYPPIEPAAVLIDWLRKREVPTLLDVKDAWPDVLLRAFPDSARSVGRIALSPYYWMMKRAFRNATGLSAMADSFLEWVLTETGRPQSAYDAVFPLTSDPGEYPTVDLRQSIAWWEDHGVMGVGAFRVAFVGTLHQSYAWEPVIQAARECPDVQFVLAGDGSVAESLRERTAQLHNVVMPGWISGVQATTLANLSDVALIPIGRHPDFERSVPNKVYDSMARGLPTLTSLSGPTRDLVEGAEIGWYYDPEDHGSLARLILEIADEEQSLHQMGARAQELFLERFKVERVYGDLVTHLECMANAGVKRV